MESWNRVSDPHARLIRKHLYGSMPQRRTDLLPSWPIHYLQESHSEAAATSSSSSSAAADGEESFDISQDKHKGQFALRKLYHASDRVIAVLYTSPTCGPCRTLKPILNGVMDEFKGKVS